MNFEKMEEKGRKKKKKDRNREKVKEKGITEDIRIGIGER